MHGLKGLCGIDHSIFRGYTLAAGTGGIADGVGVDYGVLRGFDICKWSAVSQHHDLRRLSFRGLDHGLHLQHCLLQWGDTAGSAHAASCDPDHSADNVRSSGSHARCLLRVHSPCDCENVPLPGPAYQLNLPRKADPRLFKLGSKAPQTVSVEVSNTDRAFGSIFGSEITRRYGNTLPDDTFTVQCTGAGGQSFGAFLPRGLTLSLTGDCNDYMGKGMSGGKIVVRPPQAPGFKPEENIITGNVAFYGATSGKAFINGVAGERFCVRNSGAVAVVEGVGDHGCEYMTGGCVVILGQVGKNFAAGMSGGIAYVLDEDSTLYTRVNKAMVKIRRVTDKYDVQELKGMIQEHVSYTNSEIGKRILDHFEEYLPKFKKIIPGDYEKMMSAIIQMEEKGLSREKAKIEAFNMIKNGR